MTSTPIRPDGIAPPVATYAHAVLSEASGQILHTAGVVPVLPDGTVPEDLAEQATDDLVELEELGLDEAQASALIMAARAPWFAEEAGEA